MKLFRKTLMLLFGGVFLMTSCLPSDDAINPLTGTWTLKGISCQNCVDKSQIVSTTYSCDDSGCSTYTFRDDRSVTLVENLNGTSTTIHGTYSTSGTTVSLHLEDETSSVKMYSYTFSGTMLYLKEIVDKNTGKCGSTTVLAK